jgi:hypothetical protein
MGLTLFMDANETTFFELTVQSVNYTEPNNDADGNQIVNGYLKVDFTNGTSATVTDNVDVVYFSVVAVPFKGRTF